MKRNNIKKTLPILQAIVEGKSIQWRDPGNYHNEYEDINVEELNEHQIINYSEDYRIKPKFRHFTNTEECWQDMQKHQPFGWVKCADKYFSISAIDSNNNYEIDFDDYTFADGTPFGVKVEE